MDRGSVQSVEAAERGERPRVFGDPRRWGKRALMVAVSSAVLVAVAALAASPPQPGEVVPRQIPYRGYLDQNGTPVTNSSVAMIFELFTTESGGTASWAESQPISVQQGQFTAALGDVTPIPAALFAQPSLYLQITVEGQLLAGRQRLLTVPYAQHAASSGFPPGAIIAFGGNTAPPGWLICDGAVVSRASYPQLFDVIGTTYGTGNSSSTFNLPDLRGRFLRGLDRGAGRDPGRALGQVQDWSTGLPQAGFGTTTSNLDHTHDYLDWFYAENASFGCTYVANNKVGSGSTDGGNNRCEEPRTSGPTSQSLTHAHTVIGGDTETRPTNVAVNWIIRALP